MKLINDLRQADVPDALGAAQLFGASTPVAKPLLKTDEGSSDAAEHYARVDC
jgi:hypothetical protein